MMHFFIVSYLEQRQILIWFNTMRFPYTEALPLRSGGDGQKSSPSTYTASVRSAMNTDYMQSNPQLKTKKSAKAAVPHSSRILGACYLELFLRTRQPAGFCGIIPDLLQEWKMVFLLSGFDQELLGLYHFHSPSLQSPTHHLSLHAGRAHPGLQHCSGKGKGWRG